MHAIPYPPPLAGSLPSSLYASSSSAPSSSSHRSLARLIPALSTQVDRLVASESAPSDNEQWWSATSLLAALRSARAQLDDTPQASFAGREDRARLQRQLHRDTARLERWLETASPVVSGQQTGTLFTDAGFAPSSSRAPATRTGRSQRTEALRSLLRRGTAGSGGADPEGSQDGATSSSEDDGTESEAESVLTDLEAEEERERTAKQQQKPLGGLAPSSAATKQKWADEGQQDEEDELDAYDRAASSRRPRSTAPASTEDEKASTYPPAPAAASSSSSGGAETILQSDRATHEALSSELLRMAGVLKSNSLAFADALERDRMLVEKAGEGLSSNLDLMTRTRGRLGIYSKKARSMGWFTLGAIISVVISWIVMFFVIRLT